MCRNLDPQHQSREKVQQSMWVEKEMFVGEYRVHFGKAVKQEDMLQDPISTPNRLLFVVFQWYSEPCYTQSSPPNLPHRIHWHY